MSTRYVSFKELGKVIDSGKDLFIDENGKHQYRLSIGSEKGTIDSYLYKDPDSYGQCYVTANRQGYAVADGQIIYVVEPTIVQKLAAITAEAKVSLAQKKDAETERLIKEFHERFENELLQEFTNIANTGKNTAIVKFKTGPETRVGRDELTKMGFEKSECKNSDCYVTCDCYTVNVNWPANTFFDDDDNNS